MHRSQFRANEYRLIKTFLESLHVSKPRLCHQRHERFRTNSIVCGPQHVGNTVLPTPILNAIEGQFIERAAKLPDLKQQIARTTLNTQAIRLDLDTCPVFAVVVTYGNEAAATGTDTRIQCPKSRENVLVSEQMRYGVITGHYHIILLQAMHGHVSHIRYKTVQVQMARGSFAPGACHCGVRQISGSHLISQLSQPQGLRANAARYVQNRDRLSTPKFLNDAVECCRLLGNTRFPVRINQMVKGSQLVVELVWRHHIMPNVYITTKSVSP